jgi:DnaJ-class molecular chaperone
MTRIQCPECKGQGTVPLDGVDVEDCKLCDGDGEIESSETVYI